MTFTADQYSQLAQSYDKAAADPLVPPERKAEFAKEAEWFHFLARRERDTRRSDSALTEGNIGPVNDDVVIEPDSSRHSRSMTPFLTMLWLTGAVLYLLTTLLFTNAVNLFGEEDGQTAVTVASRPVEPLPKIANVEDTKPNEQDKPQIKPVAERRHAISPDQPTYEAPTLTAPPLPLPEQELNSPSSEPTQDGARAQSGEMLRVTAAATIRSGPSTTAKKIGTATPGAELQVKARQTDWVEFVDPSSSNTGWIHSSLVAPTTGVGADELATTREAEIPAIEPPKPKLAKRAKPETVAPAQVTERQRKYVDLPDDKAFLSPRKRGSSFLAKRRMRGEGLMSPGFFPPQ